MSNFNLSGNKIDQFNNNGDNYKQTSREGDNAISKDGVVVQTKGSENQVEVGKKKDGIFAALWKAAKAWWTANPA